MTRDRFDADPFADDVEATFVGFECGWSWYVPVAELEKAPEECPVCGWRDGR